VVNDTVPATLTQFGDELVCAIARELSTEQPTSPSRGRRSRRRRRIVVAAAAGCVLAGATVGVVLVVTGGSTDSARDQHVLRAAEIALPKPSPNTILHVSVTQTMTSGARGDSAHLVPIVDAEGWFQQGPPYRSVTREHVPGQTPTWQTGSRIYDPAAKRAYAVPVLPNSPRFTLKNDPDGIDTLRVATPYGPVRQTVSSAQARALRAGGDRIELIGAWNGRRFSVSAAITPRTRAAVSAPTSTSLTFPARLHRLLGSGNARVAGRVTVDGRAAIKIAISGVPGYQRMTYFVDPTTYRPIELDSYGLSDSDLTRLVFHVYQQLPTKGNAQRLRLHTAAGTSVDHQPAGFYRHIPALVFW
jgi:hypothetical protein